MRRRGFTIIEVLVWIVLLTAAVLMGMRLFVSLMRTFREAPAQQEAMMRFDSAVRTLRDDVAGSGVFVMGPDERLMLSDGYRLEHSVAWYQDGDDLVRRQGDEIRRWNGIGQQVSLSIDGPCIVARVHGRGDETIRIMSQVQLAGRSR